MPLAKAAFWSFCKNPLFLCQFSDSQMFKMVRAEMVKKTGCFSSEWLNFNDSGRSERRENLKIWKFENLKIWNSRKNEFKNTEEPKIELGKIGHLKLFFSFEKMQKSSKSWVKIKDSLERSLARHLEAEWKMLLSLNLKKKSRKIVTFNQRVWKRGGREWLALLCNYFPYPFLKRRFGFCRRNSNAHNFFHSSGKFVCFCDLCTKLFWSARFDRVTHATFENSIEDWKLKLNPKMHLFLFFDSKFQF